MNQYETPKIQKDKHPAVKVMESILSNQDNEEFKGIIQNAESYIDIKQYITKKKMIYGVDGQKFTAQDINPWIDMLRQQYPNLEQLRNTQMYQDILGNSAEIANTEEQNSQETIDRDWLKDNEDGDTVIDNDFNLMGASTGFASVEEAKAEYDKRHPGLSASDALEKYRYRKSGGNSAESHLDK